MNGVLVIDKPSGWTSHDVVARLRSLTGERSIGHLGTLDPMATGVLPMVLGKFTRLAQFYTAADKQYAGSICLGLATDTYDADGDPVGEPKACNVGLEEIAALAQREFTGKLQQLPPPFSAKKIRGVPAYKLARKQKPVELKPVQVEVADFTLSEGVTDITSDNRYYVQSDLAAHKSRVLSFSATVSAGTYIRSLANDLGQILGCGAHLASLRRTRSGEFTLQQAVTLEQVEAAGENLPALLIPARHLLPNMPAVNATDEALARIRHGNAVNLPEFSQAKLVKVFDGQELVAIAARVAGTLFHPKVVLVEQ